MNTTHKYKNQLIFAIKEFAQMREIQEWPREGGIQPKFVIGLRI